MKDKRLDALLATLPEMVCGYYKQGITLCTMEFGEKNAFGGNYPHTRCQGDIRKCEREE